MRISPTLSTVFAFGIVAATLAVVAAVLPAKQTVPKENELAFGIEYTDPLESVVLPTTPEVADRANSNFVANTDPENLLDSDGHPIARATNPADESFPEYAGEKTDRRRLVRIASTSGTEVVEDESIAAKQKADADETMRASAISTSDIGKCDEISGERTAENCRNAIYFKQAVAERNLAKCNSITSTSPKASCQNYVSLMLKNAN